MRALGRRTTALAFAAALLTSPAAAGELPPIPDNTDGALYEVMESMTLNGVGSSQTRRATAALVGSVRAGTPICPTSLNVPRCAVNVTASDTVRVATGLGYITGDFQVVGPGDNDQDGPEQVLMSGTISADINLAPVLDKIPIAKLTNGFLKGTGARGTALDRVSVRAAFTGTFRLPFRPGPDVDESYLIIGPDGSVEIVPVRPDERSLGIATVRLDIEFQ